jgi:hypothetical protein
MDTARAAMNSTAMTRLRATVLTLKGTSGLTLGKAPRTLPDAL